MLGLNGSGKSTLLRIMAGIDTEFEGEARPQPGIKVGFLPQEPQLDPAKDVRGIVEEGGERDRRTRRALQRRSATVRRADADDDEMNKLLEEQAQARRTPSTRPAAGSSSASSRSPPTRCACRRGTPT